MTKQIISTIKVLALAVVLSFGLSYVYAWTAPSATPPSGNVAAPINTGSAAASQTILGKLTVTDTTTVNGGLIVGGLGINTTNLIADKIIIPGGTAGQVLTSDASGVATWASGGVTSLIAGTNVALSTAVGTGVVTVNAVGSTAVYLCPNINAAPIDLYCSNSCRGQLQTNGACSQSVYNTWTETKCGSTVSRACPYAGRIMP